MLNIMRVPLGNVNELVKRCKASRWLCLAIGMVLLIAGCKSPPRPSEGLGVSAAGVSNAPWLPPSLRTNEPSAASVVLRSGDVVRVVFSDLPPPPPVPLEMRISEDGKITLTFNITVQAAGKTTDQLQEAIRKEYVPKYYKHLTVTVNTIRAEDRFYYVGGDVRFPNRFMYYGHMTVLRAIDTAGGFGEFANRTEIELRRANGQVIKINGKKAITNPKLDVEVSPNDQVFVHRRAL
jgi:polysaccharide biosynthesis/export protein VpsN